MTPWRLDGAARMAFIGSGPYVLPPVEVFDPVQKVWTEQDPHDDRWLPIEGESDPVRINKYADNEPRLYDVYAGTYGELLALSDQPRRVAPGKSETEDFTPAIQILAPSVVSLYDRNEFIGRARGLASGFRWPEEPFELPPWQWRRRLEDLLGSASELIEPAVPVIVDEMLHRGAFLMLNASPGPATQNAYFVARPGEAKAVVLRLDGETAYRSMPLVDLDLGWGTLEGALHEAASVRDDQLELTLFVTDGLGGQVTLRRPPLLQKFQWELVKADGSREVMAAGEGPSPGPTVKDALETATWMVSQSEGKGNPDWRSVLERAFLPAVATKLTELDAQPAALPWRTARSIPDVQRIRRGDDRQAR